MNINLVILLSENHDKDANDIVHFPGNFEMVNVLNKTVSKEVNQGEEEYGDKDLLPQVGSLQLEQKTFEVSL